MEQKEIEERIVRLESYVDEVAKKVNELIERINTKRTPFPEDINKWLDEMTKNPL